MGGKRSSNEYRNALWRRKGIPSYERFNILSDAFLKINNLSQLIELLRLDSRDLISILNKGYDEFIIPNRKGGMRKIQSPVLSLSELQDKTLSYLNAVQVTIFDHIQPNSFAYYPTVSNKEFGQRSKNIVTNANLHVGKSLVINVDIKDFYHSITSDHIRTVFSKTPFNFPDSVVDLLINIVTYNDRLPVGAPTSPVLSNMVMLSIDQELSNIPYVTYSRYADDLTFSTDRYDKADAQLLISKVQELLSSYGFELNPRKTRYMGQQDQQLVTGLVVNQRVNVPRTYIRRIRSILHSVRTKGWSEAAEDLMKVNGHRSIWRYSRYSEMKRSNLTFEFYFPYFKSYRLYYCVEGMILHVGYVRGKKDPLFLKFQQALIDLKWDEFSRDHNDDVQLCFITKATAKNLLHHVYNYLQILRQEMKDDRSGQRHRLNLSEEIDLWNITLDQLDKDLILQKRYIPEILRYMERNDQYLRTLKQRSASGDVIEWNRSRNRPMEEIMNSFHRRTFHLSTNCELLKQDYTSGSIVLKNSGVFYDQDNKKVHRTEDQKYLLTPDYLKQLGMSCCKGCDETHGYRHEHERNYF